MRAAPSGFTFVAEGSLVRRGFATQLESWREAAWPARGREVRPDTEGRGGVAHVALPDGTGAYVRPYRHGGLLGGWLGDRYFGRSLRPWRELEATEFARQAGVLAPEVLAAVVEPRGWARSAWVYRGFLVTRALVGRRSLAAVLRATPLSQRDAWMALTVRTVRQLHDCGVRHPDLNVTNLMVTDLLADGMAVIDFDRARVGPLLRGWADRWMARRRLARSLAKLELPGLSRAECRRQLVGILGRKAP